MAPPRFTPSAKSQSSQVASWAAPTKFTPALLQRMATFPSSRSTRSAAADQAARSVTSSSRASVVAPCFRSAAAAAATFSPRLSASATRAPARARTVAIPSPMPLAAPVTKATLPWKSSIAATSARTVRTHGFQTESTSPTGRHEATRAAHAFSSRNFALYGSVCAITRWNHRLQSAAHPLTADLQRRSFHHMARTRAALLRPRIQAPAASEITHTRFLVSAERLFCVNGYEGTKIRAIATLSNANLGMLSHYWGSKRALFREVFDRRLRPIHEERMRRFRALDKLLKSGKPVSIVDVLRAQIEPSFILPGQPAADA